MSYVICPMSYVLSPSQRNLSIDLTRSSSFLMLRRANPLQIKIAIGKPNAIGKFSSPNFVDAKKLAPVRATPKIRFMKHNFNCNFLSLNCDIAKRAISAIAMQREVTKISPLANNSNPSLSEMGKNKNRMDAIATRAKKTV